MRLLRGSVKTAGRLALILLLTLPSVAQAQPAATPDPILARQKELKDLKKQMEENRRKIEDLKRKEKKLGDLDGRLKRDRELTERYLARLEDQELALLADLTDRQGELDVRTGEHDRLAASLCRRLRGYQRRRRPHAAELLLSSKSFSELFARGALVARTIQRDRVDLLWLRDQRDQLSLATSLLQSRRHGLDLLQEEKIREKARIEQKSEAAQVEIAKLAAERARFERRQKELAKSEGQIRDLLARLEEERRRASKAGRPGPSGPGLTGKRGILAWPVRGEIVGRFGPEIHPRFGTRVPNKGIDIAAPEGTSVRCIAAGTAEFVDWLPGYGRAIIVNHGGGFYTLYAHCSRVLVANRAAITEGQVIAEVGDTDSVKGSCLHFEIRRGQEAMDPTQWLR